MPIMTRPPAPPTSSSRRGERASHARAVPAATAQVLSHSTAMAANTVSEQQHLQRDVTRGRVDELRQHGGEENDRLRIAHPDHEAVPQHRAYALLARFGVESGAQRAAVPDRLHAQEDQVDGAGQLDDGEHGHRALHHRPDAQRHRRDLCVDADLAAQGGGYPGRPAQHEGAADHEEHVRPGNHDQHERHQREGEQMAGGKHAGSLSGPGRTSSRRWMCCAARAARTGRHTACDAGGRHEAKRSVRPVVPARPHKGRVKYGASWSGASPGRALSGKGWPR
jgi:hypothetical protein